MSSSAFTPDWRSNPSETLWDVLEERGWTSRDLANAAQLSEADVDEILSSRKTLARFEATKLAVALNTSVEFWLSRQFDYESNVVDEPLALKDWARQFPIADLKRLRWLNPAIKSGDAGAALLEFFGLDSLRSWEIVYEDMLSAATFRTSQTYISEFPAITAWLRRGLILAQADEVASWDEAKLRMQLPALRALTRLHDPKSFFPKVKSLCASCGISLVIAQTPKGCHASGAAMWIRDRPIILLSFRYLSDDHFWFSLFHEIGHLLLHRDRCVLVESRNLTISKEEAEADEFSADILVPEPWSTRLPTLRFRNTREVLATARDIGVSPGILIGQLQHRGVIGPQRMNSFKRRFHWDELTQLLAEA